MSRDVFDTTRCLLGEGAFWHPERHQFFWCDILSRRILTRANRALYDYPFAGFVSAMGWIDADTLLVATGTELQVLDLQTEGRRPVARLEEEGRGTRVNDGRADPFGGFWISTMSIAKTRAQGAIYRYYRGEVRRLVEGVSIGNAICFAPDAGYAYYTDTPTQIVMRWRLGPEGWPEGDPEPHVDETADGHRPDGAVCDAEGNLWVSHWGSSRVACYRDDGTFRDEVRLPAAQITCPAFGGEGLADLYATSAAVGLDETALTDHPHHGCTFRVAGVGRGQPEHRVIL